MRLFIFQLVLLVPVFAKGQVDTTQKVTANRSNAVAQQSRPYVILISIDGLRYDFVKKHHASNLSRLSRQGAAATFMMPSYPSLTFPNHYSIVTGLYPAHHGLVDNDFYDSKHEAIFGMHQEKVVRDSSWYRGTPLWVLAEKQKMLTASYYWPGSEAAILGIRPTYYYHYAETVAIPRRLNTVKEWLQLPEGQRPHLITFYFPEVDDQAHHYGPESREVAKAIQEVDDAIGQLAAMTDSLKLPVNFIIVSDHGMAAVDIKHPLAVPAVLRDTALCRVVGGSTLLHVYVKEKGKILSVYHHLLQESDMDIYLPQDIPSRWHYGPQDDWEGRIGDIIVVARYPRVFKLGTKELTPGKHGFDPAMTEMHATFLAWGPSIRAGVIVPPFENVNVFPLVAKILGLNYFFTVDGNDKDVLKGVLR